MTFSELLVWPRHKCRSKHEAKREATDSLCLTLHPFLSGGGVKLLLAFFRREVVLCIG